MPRGQKCHFVQLWSLGDSASIFVYFCIKLSHFLLTNGLDIGSVLFGNVQPLFQLATILVLETSPGHQSINH